MDASQLFRILDKSSCYTSVTANVVASFCLVKENTLKKSTDAYPEPD
jgi:hypothetical protein